MNNHACDLIGVIEDAELEINVTLESAGPRGEKGAKLIDVVIQYAANDSNTTPPTTGWTTQRPR